MQSKVSVFYDGLCHLCSREIAHYRRAAGSDALEFVDITDPTFDAEKLNLDPERVNQEMHVRRRDGSLAVGVEAFIALWQQLPGYRWMARAASFPPMHLLLRLGYSIFARVRPWLPRKQQVCSVDRKPEGK